LLIAGSSLCPAQDVTFRSDAQLMQYVNGLKLADFELLVDSRPRPITTFEGSRKELPVEIVLLFDTSGSVTGNGLLDQKLFRDNLLAGC
jgi:hypothetical protein